MGKVEVDELLDPRVHAALDKIGYDGFLSAEILPLPDAETAARATMRSFQKLTR